MDDTAVDTDRTLAERQAQAALNLAEALDRLERLGRQLNAVVHPLPSPARASDGPLLGMPIAVKDMFDVAGQPRGNGNPEDMAGPVAMADAPAITALRAAGADVFAIAAMLEYAAGAQHPDLPEARNPVDPSRTAGGSSGGSAALVGAGVCPAALGTDTGGSIRLPAHYCGVVGFKPSFGTLPADGVQPLSPTLDHVGILAKDVETTATVFDAMRGRAGEPAAPAAADAAAGLTIGVLGGQLADPRLDREIAAIVSSAVETLGASGASGASVTIVDVDSTALTALNIWMGDIVSYEAWQIHGAAMTERPEHFGAPTARRFRSAGKITEEAYEAAMAARNSLLPMALALLDGVDVLVGPAGPYAAPSVSPPGDTPEGAIEGIFTQPYNLTGQPAIVLPCGTTADGLPVGLQLAAAVGADDQLLAAASVVERILRGEPRMTTLTRIPYVTNRKRNTDTVIINTNRRSPALGMSRGSNAHKREV
jgi:aspartyl-tRNA(Asn)/glutamyl-tRNA(Gln) amidotransferase subunit A